MTKARVAPCSLHTLFAAAPLSGAPRGASAGFPGYCRHAVRFMPVHGIGQVPFGPEEVDRVQRIAQPIAEHRHCTGDGALLCRERPGADPNAAAATTAVATAAPTAAVATDTAAAVAAPATVPAPGAAPAA